MCLRLRFHDFNLFGFGYPEGLGTGTDLFVVLGVCERLGVSARSNTATKKPSISSSGDVLIHLAATTEEGKSDTDTGMAVVVCVLCKECSANMHDHDDMKLLETKRRRYLLQQVFGGMGQSIHPFLRTDDEETP